MTKTKSSAKATAKAKAYQHQSQVVNFSIKNYVMPASYKKHSKAKRKVVKVIDEEKTLAYMVQLKRMAETELYYKLNNLNNAKRELADAEYAYRKKIAEDEKERSQKDKEAIDKQLADMKEYQEALQDEIRKLREQIATQSGGGDDAGGGQPVPDSGGGAVPVPPIPETPEELRERLERYWNTAEQLIHDYLPSRTELGTATAYSQEESSVVIEEINAVNTGQQTIAEAAANVAERTENISADEFAAELQGRLENERLNQEIQAIELEHNQKLADEHYEETGVIPTIDDFVEAREMVDVRSNPNTIRTRANRGRFASYGEEQTREAYANAIEHLQDREAVEVGELVIPEGDYYGFTTPNQGNTIYTTDDGVRYDTGRRMNAMEEHEWLNDHEDHIEEHGRLTAEEQVEYDELYEPDDVGELEQPTEPLTAEDHEYISQIDETSEYLESELAIQQAENIRLQEKMNAGEIPDMYDPNYNPRTPTQDAITRMEQGSINSREAANLRALTAETSGIGTITRSDPRLGRMTRSMTEEMGIRTPPEEVIGTSTFTETSLPPSPPREIISPPPSPPRELISDTHLGKESLNAHEATMNAHETLSNFSDKEALSGLSKDVASSVKGSKIYEIGKASLKPKTIAKGLGASIVGGLAVSALDKSKKGDFDRGAEGEREHAALQEGITLGLIGADVAGPEGAILGTLAGASAGYVGKGLTQGLDKIGADKHFSTIAGDTTTAALEGAAIGGMVGGVPAAVVGGIAGFVVGGVSSTLHEAFSARAEKYTPKKHRTPLSVDDYKLYDSVKQADIYDDLTKDQKKVYDDLSTSAMIFGAPKGY